MEILLEVKKQNKTKMTIVLTFLQSTLPSSDAE